MSKNRSRAASSSASYAASASRAARAPDTSPRSDSKPWQSAIAFVALRSLARDTFSGRCDDDWNTRFTLENDGVIMRDQHTTAGAWQSLARRSGRRASGASSRSGRGRREIAHERRERFGARV
jgi:hypothetical protein